MVASIAALNPLHGSRRSSRGKGASLPRPVVPFLFGALIGGIAGTVLGSLVSGLLSEAITDLYRVTTRRDNQRDQPPFDLLMQ